MKKLILLSGLFLIGCIEHPKYVAQTDKPEASEKYVLDDEFVIREIDGCEYIVYSRGALEYATYGMAHKGNCKFCVERLKEIISSKEKESVNIIPTNP